MRTPSHFAAIFFYGKSGFASAFSKKKFEIPPEFPFFVSFCLLKVVYNGKQGGPVRWRLLGSDKPSALMDQLNALKLDSLDDVIQVLFLTEAVRHCTT
jgi:hypothetical protein